MKKVICTYYDSENKSGKMEYTGYEEQEQIELQGNGDFRSTECVEILKECDIVVTNPPFSLFRTYIQQLIEYDKNFTFKGNVGFFQTPYEDTAVSSDHKEGLLRVSGLVWYSNIERISK